MQRRKKPFLNMTVNVLTSYLQPTDGRIEVILLLYYFIKSSRTSKLPPAEV